MYPHGSPAFSRRQLRALLALTFLAWAIQTWTSTFARGEEAVSELVAEPTLACMPISRPVALELRGEATVVGGEIRFAQIARWADGDADVLAPVGELVVARFNGQTAVKKLTLDEVRVLLRAAGVNVAPLNFSGPRACTVNRSDVRFEPGAALKQYGDAEAQTPQRDAVDTVADSTPDFEPAVTPHTKIDAARGAAALPVEPARPAVQVIEPQAAPQIEVADRPHQTLRERLTSSLSEQLNLSLETLQVSFAEADENVLRLTEPHCAFRIESPKTKDVGDVSWVVTVTAAEKNMPLDPSVAGRRLLIKASVRAWQDQTVAVRPISAGQVITEEDLLDRRVLVARLGDLQPAPRKMLVGRQAVRDLRTGTVLTEKHVDVATLVRPGQIVTVTLARGGVAVTSVARAIDGGSLGQSIRVKSETRNDVYRVQITGPQEATASVP